MIKELIFWLHFGLGLAGATVGFYLSLPLVVGLVIAHRVHLVVFNGCFITRIQHYLGHFSRQVDFLEVVAKRFTKRDITRLQLKAFDYSLGVIPILVASLRFVN